MDMGIPKSSSMPLGPQYDRNPPGAPLRGASASFFSIDQSRGFRQDARPRFLLVGQELCSFSSHGRLPRGFSLSQDPETRNVP